MPFINQKQSNIYCEKGIRVKKGTIKISFDWYNWNVWLSTIL